MVTDHRDLNHDMAIFATDPLAGSGLPMWLPTGAVVREELQKLAKELASSDGCLGVFSPVLGKRALYERSGHLSKFSQDMFPAMRIGDDEVMLRPANCPHHALIYASDRRSYRELPLRFNELASMFRAERSGVLSGLNRVRQINLDDTHVFCRPDQVLHEAELGLRAALRAQEILGLPVDYVRLSMRDNSAAWLGTEAQWEHAQEQLRAAGSSVLDEHGPNLVEAPGEAAFYGPKLDLQVNDGRGHEETIATVQLDFNQPERFDLTYVGADGGDHRPVMIHRGTVGSMERVTAALLERYSGRLPFWLAPVQVTVLPVTAEQDAVARAFADVVRQRGLRSRVDHDGSLGARVRKARKTRDHLIAVIGQTEIAQKSVQITDVASGVRTRISQEQLLGLMDDAYRHRRATLDWALCERVSCG
ncbi:threonine--tRNA ligase [Rhodococcus sp. IEGM 1307]|uniref:threonine--tRNA ligase n=1 Tax=Rhodococcus sp. IEGM 1307 TaxID=3047091 RepID=UPI0024B69881|nr:threonine--tRNA ligase [Rhodococcus sp. IEGM 1307]MDI9973717.1 threonine--tRNA ligase [Rhodococcus sp. IEGM 1307]